MDQLPLYPSQTVSMTESPTQYYRHGRFRVEGGVLPDAITAFKTYGDPKNPCIIFPTCYSGKLDSRSISACLIALQTLFLVQLYMIGEGKVRLPVALWSYEPTRRIRPWTLQSTLLLRLHCSRTGKCVIVA